MVISHVPGLEQALCEAFHCKEIFTLVGDEEDEQVLAMQLKEAQQAQPAQPAPSPKADVAAVPSPVQGETPSPAAGGAAGEGDGEADDVVASGATSPSGTPERKKQQRRRPSLLERSASYAQRKKEKMQALRDARDAEEEDKKRTKRRESLGGRSYSRNSLRRRGSRRSSPVKKSAPASPEQQQRFTRPIPQPQVLWDGRVSGADDERPTLLPKARLMFFRVDPNDERALKFALRRAHVLLADPDVFGDHIHGAERLKWVHSTFSGVDALVSSFQDKQVLIDKRREEHEKLKQSLVDEQAALEDRRLRLQREFEEHSPLLREATRKLSDISRNDLAMLRSMARPPASVRLCIEAVVTLLGHDTEEWKEALRVVAKSDFIKAMLSFEAFSVAEERQQYIQREFIESPEWSLESMDRAHSACGSLARWLLAQLKLSEAREVLQPLLLEVNRLQAEIAGLAAQIEESEEALNKLTRNIDFALTHSTGFGPDIAQYCVGHICMVDRHLHELHRLQGDGTWKPAREYQYRSCFGRTAAVLGLGDVGTAVARALKGLGIRVHALVNRDRDRDAGDADEVFVNDSRDALPRCLRDCSYVINTLPSTKSTRDILSGDALKPCKNAILVNVGRGSAIDGDSVLRALKKGWLSAAVLDVHEVEPLPESSPLWSHPNVFVTPHIAGLSKPKFTVQLFQRALAAFLQDKPLPGLVSWKDGY